VPDVPGINLADSFSPGMAQSSCSGSVEPGVLDASDVMCGFDVVLMA